MKEENQNGGGVIKRNRILLLIIVFLLIITITIGITYAFWRIDEIQQEKNIAKSECLKITFNEENEGVSLLKAYPISDDEGLSLTPYTFTIQNICENSWTSYQINLETLTGSTLKEEYLKASLSVGKDIVIKKLTPELQVTKTLEDAIRAYKLLEGKLKPNEQITYNLRLWMDSEVTAEETDSMNATYESKVTIQFSYMEEPKYLADSIKKLASEDENVCGESGLVQVNHENADIVDAGYNLLEKPLNFEEVAKNLKEIEYRYCGSDPDNYVTFNGEVAGWRIIGLVNTPEGQRIKLISTRYEDKKWNENNVNDWTNASLQEYFNGDYLNNFNTESKSMIDTITWNLGGFNNSTITTKQYYNYERGTTVYNGRPKLWQGKIALMYPSDYGYATSGGSTLDRESCLAKDLYHWDSTDTATPYKKDCAYNDWLLNKGNWQWTIMSDSSLSSCAFNVYNAGYVYNGNSVGNANAVVPVLYLKSDVQIERGTGKSTDPYTLEQG